MEKDLGANPALVASDQAAARLAPTGFDHGERGPVDRVTADQTPIAPIDNAVAWLLECHAWMMANDLDMTCPMEADPDFVATELECYAVALKCELANLVDHPNGRLHARIADLEDERDYLRERLDKKTDAHAVEIARKNAVLADVERWILHDLGPGTPRASAVLNHLAAAIVDGSPKGGDAKQAPSRSDESDGA